MVPSDENTGFAIGNLVALKMSGLDDDEELIAVHLNFRHLPPVQCVFDGKRMQVKHRLQARHFLDGRVGDTDPGKLAVPLGERSASQGEFFGTLAKAVDVGSYNCHENRSELTVMIWYSDIVVTRWNGRYPIRSESAHQRHWQNRRVTARPSNVSLPSLEQSALHTVINRRCKGWRWRWFA